MTTLCAPRHRPVFKTAGEAREVLAQDRLGTVYHAAKVVWVVTTFGTGTFSREEWERSAPAEAKP